MTVLLDLINSEYFVLIYCLVIIECFVFFVGLLVSALRRLSDADEQTSPDTSTAAHPVNLDSYQFYQAVPNLLTGLGILGTFLGLVGGVSEAGTQFAADPDSAIDSLLEGAALAFWTSVVGIFLSIVFTLIERTNLRPVVDRQRGRAEDLRQNQFTRYLGSLVREVKEVSRNASTAAEQLQEVTGQFKSFRDEFKWGELEAILDSVLENLSKEIAGLRADLEGANQSVMDSTMEQFAAALDERAGLEFKGLAETITGLDQVVAQAAQELVDRQENMEESLRQTLSELVSEMDRASSKVAWKLRVAGSAAVDRISEAISGVAGDLESAVATISDAVRLSERSLGSLTSFVDQADGLFEMIRETQQKTRDSMGAIQQAVDTSRVSTDRLANSLRDVDQVAARAGELVIDSSELLSKSQDWNRVMINLWKNYEERFEGIDESLAEVFQGLDEGLQQYRNQVEDFVRTLDHKSAVVVERLSGAVSELREVVEELIDEMTRDNQRQ